MSAFLISDPVHWVEFRLRQSIRATEREEDEWLFILHGKESLQNNMRHIRRQIQAIISRCSNTVTGRVDRFRLAIYPRHQVPWE